MATIPALLLVQRRLQARVTLRAPSCSCASDWLCRTALTMPNVRAITLAGSFSCCRFISSTNCRSLARRLSGLSDNVHCWPHIGGKDRPQVVAAVKSARTAAGTNGREGGTAAGGGVTSVGDDCLIMSHCHVAHDCVLGDGVLLASSAALAGHVQVGDGAFVLSVEGVYRLRVALPAGRPDAARDHGTPRGPFAQVQHRSHKLQYAARIRRPSRSLGRANLLGTATRLNRRSLKPLCRCYGLEAASDSRRASA